MRKLTTTPGPASGTDSLSTKKMPVPTVAPTPNIISWNVVRLRASSSPSWWCCRKTIGLRRVSCSPSDNDMVAPPPPRHDDVDPM